MHTDFAERRRHIRVYFDATEEMGCEFSNGAGATKMLRAAVLDLSLGGLHLSVTGDCHFAVGDRIILTRLMHRTGLVSEEEIPMEIRWIFAQAEFSRLYIGCQFLALPEESRGNIANLISVKLLESSSARIALSSKSS
jgi:c-di-GMP-binding flagellar brake protein YcgR